MQDVWQRIENWLELNSPEILADLLPGVSDDQIFELEQKLQIQFTEDFKASYRIHNGSRGGGPPLMGAWRLLKLDLIDREWSLQEELSAEDVFEDDECEHEDPIQPVWWNAQWIPISSNSSGDFICLDLNPEPGGSIGQIISYWHTDPVRKILAHSFREWLIKFADDLEANRYQVEGDWLVFRK
jgi:cell wall assembly regulator SMI1